MLAGCGRGREAVRGLDQLRQAPLHTFNEQEIDGYLRWLSGQELSRPERVALLARQTIGQPYRLGVLGEFPFELYDPDPLYNLSAADCVTFVEQTYALALARDWGSFMRTLQSIRYQEGTIGLLTRNHFMEADWNVNNAWLFDDVTKTVAGDVGVRPMCTRVDRRALLARYGVECDAPLQFWEDSYIARDALPASLQGIKAGDLIEIVKGDADWQYVSHVGILLRDAADRVTMVHATKPAVREQALEDYFAAHADILGFKLLRLRLHGRSPGPTPLPMAKAASGH